jgi:serine/threonine protein kinase
MIDFEQKYRKYTKEFNELNFISDVSFGSVYKAIDKKSKKLFSIKKLPIEELSKKKVLREIEFLSKLKSKYIVRLKSFSIEKIILKIIRTLHITYCYTFE